ncbi:MAG: hypothetical protein M1818_001395 [Claussenomyces sp. TS43310]|nr:MAG: hypothetical protein M1818_001395 [Claussenomyces sp. TS43310]
MADTEKPSVLIIGGLGYVGRFLALQIHKENLASELRLVDKVLPQLAWLAPEFEEACCKDRFIQADASREQSMSRIFDRADGKQWDYVFNCGGETKFSQEDEVYKARSLALSLAVGREAAKRGVKVFVEVSSGMVYKPDPVPRKETDKTKPVVPLAKYKLQAEDELAKIPGLNLIIMRLAHVYGEYDSKFISMNLVVGRVYKTLDHGLKYLWTKDLRCNTVHVLDACRALWQAAEWYAHGKKGWDSKAYGTTPIFNLVDKGNTSLGTISDLIGSIFGIETGFQGTLISAFARLNLDSVIDDINDETLQPWADLLEDANITRPGPITPFAEREFLWDMDLSLDGSRFEKVVGFTHQYPKLTKEELEKMIESYKRMNWWPS